MSFIQDHAIGGEKEPFLLKVNDEFSIAMETSHNPNYPHEMYVGIVDATGVWIQDIATVRIPYTYPKRGEAKFDESQVELLSWENVGSEDYTRAVKIPVYKEPKDDEETTSQEETT